MHTGVEPLTVTLQEVCFLHWLVTAEHADDLLPNWLTPDEADGSAWISAVLMEIERFDAFGLPVREDVSAVNVRTYVRAPDGDRGVYFLSLDLSDRTAAETARGLFRLPYYAADVDWFTNGDETSVRTTRRDDSGRTLEVTYQPSGPTQRASPDTLASFLAERYRYFTEGPLGTRLVGSVGHDPWELQSATATVTEDSLVAAGGVRQLEKEPLAHYSAGTEMRIGPPKPLWLED